MRIRKNTWIRAGLAAFLVSGMAMTVHAEEGYRYEPEYQRYADGVYGGILENDLAVYALNPVNNLIMYLDEEEMAWYPLCGKPECRHEPGPWNGESDCNASTGTWMPLIQWKDRIWYMKEDDWEDGIAYWVMGSMNLDGTDHKKQRMGVFEYEVSYEVCLNNGFLYLFSRYDNGEQPNRLTAISFDDPENGTSILYEGEEEFSVSFYRDQKIILSRCIPEENDLWVFYEMDSKGGEPELFLEDPFFGCASFYEDGYYKYRQKEGLFYQKYGSDEETLLYDPGTDYDCDFCLYDDGEFFYLVGMEDIYEGVQGDCDLLLILDRSGNLLETMSLPNPARYYQECLDKRDALNAEKKKDPELIEEIRLLTDCYINMNGFWGMSDDYVFAYESYLPGYYLEKSEIGSGNCEWKRIAQRAHGSFL